MSCLGRYKFANCVQISILIFCVVRHKFRDTRKKDGEISILDNFTAIELADSTFLAAGKMEFTYLPKLIYSKTNLKSILKNWFQLDPLN